MRLSLLLVAAVGAFLGAALLQAATVPVTLLKERSTVTDASMEGVSEALPAHNDAAAAAAVFEPSFIGKRREVQLVTRAPMGFGKWFSKTFSGGVQKHPDIGASSTAEGSNASSASTSSQLPDPPVSEAAYQAQLQQTEFGTRLRYLAAVEQSDRSSAAYLKHLHSAQPKYDGFRELPTFIGLEGHEFTAKQLALYKQRQEHRKVSSALSRLYFHELDKLSRMNPAKHSPEVLKTYRKWTAAREEYIENGGHPDDFHEWYKMRNRPRN